ncbi:cullin-4A [Xylariomycetidae sp. FL0641]|nr:cullin-4A [Xylariomycetidae sp. FL0641]
MPPPFGSPLDGPRNSIATPSKRKSAGGTSSSSRHPSDSQASGPDSKRFKVNKALQNPAMTSMNRDLGRDADAVYRKPKQRPVFHPNHGAKKLVIKNLRTTSQARDLELYYEKARNDLQDALEAIFAQKQPAQPLERLYRAVEDLCRHGSGRELYDMLRHTCDAYLKGRMYESIKTNAGPSNVDMLRSLHKHWILWDDQSTLIRSVFSYLDRSFLLNSKDLPQINDLAIALFRRMAYLSLTPNSSSPGATSIAGMCELVDYDRRGDARFDPTLLRDSIHMLHVLNIYLKSFEPRFLEASAAYFQEFGEEQSSGSLKSYIAACRKLLIREEERCNAFNFDSTTKRQLTNQAHSILIDSYSEKLLDSGSISKILDEQAVESMQALYELLRLTKLQKRLKEPWVDYIKAAGSGIVNNKAKGDQMVVRLLEFRRALDIMVRDAFQRDDEFTYGLRQAFSSFINDKQVSSSWDTGTSKVGEMIAKYIDMLLRGGLKAVPKSLLSDAQDRVEAERSGQASVGDEDAELDRQLDQAVELFRFIEGKDVFEAFYKQDLARRLLMGRSANADAERSMLAKLKSECGSNFTYNLEIMFKDQQTAREEMAAYKTWREGNGLGKDHIDLAVSILSAAAWPAYPDSQLRLPAEVASRLEQFDKFYVNRHTGRRLQWKHSLAHCVLKARFNKGPKELVTSAYQAVVLTLFNQVEGKEDEVLSYQQIAEHSGLGEQDLVRTLQSLACSKTRVLTKHPKGKDVDPTDTFTVNKAFTDPKYRVKINQVQHKETKEENRETHKRVAQDRQFETQAAIVRIMKSRKKMTHANLVAEVINQTKKRGAVDTAEIKKNIEK